MTFCDERNGGCGASLTATDYEAGYCTNCNHELTTKETAMRYECEECGHPLKEGDETHYDECSQADVG